MKSALGVLFFLASMAFAASSSHALDMDELTAEELEQLSRDVLESLPVPELIARVSENQTRDGENLLDMVNLLLWSSLREFFYLDTPGPEGEKQFRAAITAFQSELDEEQSGEITLGQFGKLQRMTRELRDSTMYPPPGMNVAVQDNIAWAKGSWLIESEDIATPVNASEITCYRVDQVCYITRAEVAIPFRAHRDEVDRLKLSTSEYEVLAWTDTEVIARSADDATSPCRPTMLTLSTESQTVHEIADNAVRQDCGDSERFAAILLDAPQRSRLVDGPDQRFGSWEQRREETMEAFRSVLEDSFLEEAMNRALQ